MYADLRGSAWGREKRDNIMSERESAGRKARGDKNKGQFEICDIRTWPIKINVDTANSIGNSKIMSLISLKTFEPHTVYDCVYYNDLKSLNSSGSSL